MPTTTLRASCSALMLALSLSLALTGCGGSVPPPAAPLSPPTELCSDLKPRRECRTVSEIEAWLADPALEILGAADTPDGIQGAKILTLRATSIPGAPTFRAKWRAYSTLSSLNDPRRELAAYAVQRLFLEPHQYVVPPTAAYCFPLMAYRAQVDAQARANPAQTACAFGVLAYWLEGARSLDVAEDYDLIESGSHAYDRELFKRSASYRDSAAHVNLLAHLIDHGDSHPAQFLMLGELERPRLYIVDNSMSFGVEKNPALIEDWSRLLVPSLPHATLARVQGVRSEQLAALNVIQQLRLERGRLFASSPTAVRAGHDAGLRWAERELQIGLTRGEIAALRARHLRLVRSIAAGQLRTHPSSS